MAEVWAICDGLRYDWPTDKSLSRLGRRAISRRRGVVRQKSIAIDLWSARGARMDRRRTSVSQSVSERVSTNSVDTVGLSVCLSGLKTFHVPLSETLYCMNIEQWLLISLI